jgi:hypothetical protein
MQGLQAGYFCAAGISLLPLSHSAMLAFTQDNIQKEKKISGLLLGLVFTIKGIFP